MKTKEHWFLKSSILFQKKSKEKVVQDFWRSVYIQHELSLNIFLSICLINTKHCIMYTFDMIATKANVSNKFLCRGGIGQQARAS